MNGKGKCILDFSETFSISELFSKSNSFSISDTFSKSHSFTMSDTFTKSNSFTMSEIFTASENFSATPTQSLHSHAISKSVSFQLSYIQVKSIDKTNTLYLKETYIHTYIDGSPVAYETQTYLPTVLFYIIHFLSPTYLRFEVSYEIVHPKKKISREMLIGIVCGSTAVFFAVLGFTIMVIRKKRTQEFSSFLENSSDSEYVLDETS